MAEPGVDLGAVVADPDQAAHLGRIDGVLTGQFAQRVDIERFAQRQQLQGVDDLGAGLLETGFQQLGQTGRHHRGSAQLPDVVHLGQRSGIHRPLDQMPQKQRIAARGFPHHVSAQTLQRPTEHRFDQRNALVLRERLELDALQEGVLPQRGDGVGNRFPAADRGQNASRPVHPDLVQQGRRQLVQQLRIVDADDGIPLADKGFPRRSDERDRVARC